MINIFDMMGPVMVGPSSSHTAGAARIGNMGRTLLGEEVARADIGLYGSFAETGYGHGTDRALLAGLLGMKPDDLRIPNAYEEANRAGMAYSFRTVELRDAHPNTALLELTGKSGKKLTLQASSIGGGAIVLPGVHIGSGSVIGAGSVVTKDIPAMSLAAGNPCRVIREITAEDMRYYFRDREFDEESAAEIKKFMEK